MPQAAAGVLLMALPGTVPAAHAQSRVGVVTTLQGPATVARVRIPTPEPLKFRDEIFLYDRIATGENAFARILLGGKALVTMRERSTLHLTEVPGTATVELGAGSIGLAVLKEKMKSAETVAIRTPNAIAAIRGTVVIAEYRQDISSFTAIRGVVDVMRLDPATRQIVGPPVRLHPMHRIDVHGTGPLQPQPVTQEALRRIGAEYKVTSDEQPGGPTAAQPSSPVAPTGAGPGAGTSGAGPSGPGAGGAGAGGIGAGSTTGSTGSGISSGSGGRGPTPLPITPLPTVPGPGVSGGDRSGSGSPVDSGTRDSGTRGSGSSGSGSSGSGSGVSGGGGRGKR